MAVETLRKERNTDPQSGITEDAQRRANVLGAYTPVDPELERRIAALVSSGEETVSYTEAEKALRGWLNRRRHNQPGLIPRLEGELEEVERQLSLTTHTLRRAAEAQVQVEELERRKQKAAERYTDAGADLVIDSIRDLPAAVSEINRRMAEKEAAAC